METDIDELSKGNLLAGAENNVAISEAGANKIELTRGLRDSGEVLNPGGVGLKRSCGSHHRRRQNAGGDAHDLLLDAAGSDGGA